MNRNNYLKCSKSNRHVPGLHTVLAKFTSHNIAKYTPPLLALFHGLEGGYPYQLFSFILIQVFKTNIILKFEWYFQQKYATKTMIIRIFLTFLTNSYCIQIQYKNGKSLNKSQDFGTFLKNEKRVLIFFLLESFCFFFFETGFVIFRFLIGTLALWRAISCSSSNLIISASKCCFCSSAFR